MRSERCSDCRKAIQPGDEGLCRDDQCQLCWEAECERAWWGTVTTLSRAGLLGDQ